MINYDDITKENIKQYHLNWPQIPDHPHRLLIIEGSESGKTNALLNLVKKHDANISVIDKVCLYVKDPNQAKYQYLI